VKRMCVDRQMLTKMPLVLSAVLGVGLLSFHAEAGRNDRAEFVDQLKFKAGDESGNEMKALKTEMLVMRSEKKALEQLQSLRKRHKGTRMEGEILYRLAEIHMRRARTSRFFEVHRDSQQILKVAPTLVKEASEVRQIKQALSVYSELESKFPRFRALDIVIFNSAYAHQQIGQHDLAKKHLQRLLAQHPQSPLVPDALLSLGELHFQDRQFQAALTTFLKIKAYPEARAYPYGLYKAAWSRYNMQDEEGAIRLLEETIAFGHLKAKEDQLIGGQKLDLRKEALSDLALFYSESRTAKGAVAYFAQQAGELDPAPYVLRLVEIYKRHSKYDETDVVLRDILQRLPKSEQIASVHEELIWNAERQKRRDVATTQLTELEKHCEALKGEPAKSGESQTIHSACVEKLSATSKKLGAKFHAQWKREKSDALADQSMTAYRIYLQNTPVLDRDAAQVQFAYADLLFARARFREASEAYAVVSSAVLKNQSSKLAKSIKGVDLMKADPKLVVDAAYGAALSLERAVGEGKWSDEDEQRFAKLSGDYVRLASAGPHILDLRFKRAFIAYEKEKYDLAAREFYEIGWVQKHETQLPKVQKSQDLYLDILNIKKDWAGLKAAAQSLLESGRAGGREESLAKVRREAWFAEIGELADGVAQAEASRGQNLAVKKSVEAFQSFARENRGSELGARAWWNASQLLIKDGQAWAAAHVCREMPVMFAGQAQVKPCLEQAVRTYEAGARLDLAAQVAMDLSLVDVENRTRWQNLATDFQALSGAAELKRKAGEALAQKASEAREPAAQSAAYERVWALAVEIKDSKLLSKLRNEIEGRQIEPLASRFTVEEAERLWSAGEATQAFNLAKKVVGRESTLKSQGRLDLPARARLVQARVLEEEYRSQSVKARVERLGLVLAIKTEKLEKAQKAYQSAARFGDPDVASEALARLAEIYVDFARTVKAIQLPGDVPESDRKVFQAEIEQIALPMEEKGIEALAQAIESAKKAKRFDGLSARLQARLDELNLKPKSDSPSRMGEVPQLAPILPQWTDPKNVQQDGREQSLDQTALGGRS